MAKTLDPVVTDLERRRIINVQDSSKNLKRNLSAELANAFDLDEIKSEVRFWNQFVNYLRGRAGVTDKDNNFIIICGLCLAQPKEQKFLVKFRKEGLRRMNMFLLNSTRNEVQMKDAKLLTWSCLSLLSFYFSKHQNQWDDCRCFNRQKFDQAKTVFRSAMYLILPEKQLDVIRHTIRYITLTHQWNSEDYDSFVFQELQTMITKPEWLLAKIIKQVEVSQRQGEIKEARDISCTLSTVLERASWDKYLFNHLLHNCFNTLLKLYLICTMRMPSNMKLENSEFQTIIRSCIKFFISNIRDNQGLVSVMDAVAKCLQDDTISTDSRIELMEIIAFCAVTHQTKNFRESIPPNLLNLLLNHLFLKENNLPLISHKIFHHILDRQENLKYFTEPVYYFKGRSNFNINYECSIEDIHFFKSFSKRFFEGIRWCFQIHQEKEHLVIFYITLCIVLVELPEPVITINIIHVLITVQQDVLANEETLPIIVKSQIHGIIAAILSLICLIHKDEVTSLNKYVEEVVRFRTENAPHLLPPLLNSYQVASHHTTAYHDQLYFLEDEVLYALQRCWFNKRIADAK